MVRFHVGNNWTVEASRGQREQTYRIQAIAIGIVIGLVVLLLLTNLTITLIVAFPVLVVAFMLWHGQRLEEAKREEDGES